MQHLLEGHPICHWVALLSFKQQQATEEPASSSLQVDGENHSCQEVDECFTILQTYQLGIGGPLGEDVSRV